MSNPLAELAKVGQSVWYDQMERKLISTGKLKQMIEQDDLRGLTSNPTIFEKAIAGGSVDYDEQLKTLAAAGKNRDEIYEELVVDDISHAADVFLPVYEKTKGLDGYVSLEVSPLLARETQATIDEAKKLFKRLGRKNVMIKIPATPEGIPAIEEAIANGINVNVTLIFNNKVYADVMEAYIKGLERRAAAGQPIDHISSVASFFVSRIDALAEKQMDAKAASADPKARDAMQALYGKIAIANAKTAYDLFKKTFASERFQKLKAKGARVQRPLWASTGTKSAKYSDVMYPEALIGPDTVDTVPPATYEAFRDHGKVSKSLEADLEGAKAALKKFEDLGFSLMAITEQLTADGVKSFEQSFQSLMNSIETRRVAAVGSGASRSASAAKPAFS